MPKTDPFHHRSGRHKPGRLLWVIGLAIGIAAGAFAAIELTSLSEPEVIDSDNRLH